jgi:hypothetical protein
VFCIDKPLGGDEELEQGGTPVIREIDPHDAPELGEHQAA